VIVRLGVARAAGASVDFPLAGGPDTNTKMGSVVIGSTGTEWILPRGVMPRGAVLNVPNRVAWGQPSDPGPAAEAFFEYGLATSHVRGRDRRTGAWHASGPMGRLEFDSDDLVIRSTNIARRLGIGEVRTRKADTKAIRLSTGVLAVRVSVVRSDGTELEPYFACDA